MHLPGRGLGGLIRIATGTLRYRLRMGHNEEAPTSLSSASRIKDNIVRQKTLSNAFPLLATIVKSNNSIALFSILSQLAEARLENADGGNGRCFSSQDLLTKGNGYDFRLLGNLHFFLAPASLRSD